MCRVGLSSLWIIQTLGTFYSIKNFSWISGHFQWCIREQNFLEFPESEKTLEGIPNFSKHSFPFLSHLILLLQFPEFSVKWLTFWKFNNSWISRNLPRKFPYNLPPCWKIQNFWPNGKHPWSCIYLDESSKLINRQLLSMCT